LRFPPVNRVGKNVSSVVQLPKSTHKRPVDVFSNRKYFGCIFKRSIRDTAQRLHHRDLDIRVGVHAELVLLENRVSFAFYKLTIVFNEARLGGPVRTLFDRWHPFCTDQGTTKRLESGALSLYPNVSTPQVLRQSTAECIRSPDKPESNRTIYHEGSVFIA
jgi:hypothetical protein